MQIVFSAMYFITALWVDHFCQVLHLFVKHFIIPHLLCACLQYFELFFELCINIFLGLNN